MSRRLTTTIGHRVIRAEDSETKPRQGHFVTLAIVAAIGIAAGSILVLATGSGTSGVPQSAGIETRHIMSSVAGRVAAYPVPGKQDPLADAEFEPKQGMSTELVPAPRLVAISIVAGTKKNPRLADTTGETLSGENGQPRDVSLPQPAPERFGGSLPANGAKDVQTRVEPTEDGEAKPASANSEPGVRDQQSATVVEMETAAVELEVEPGVSDPERAEFVADPIAPNTEADVPLSKRRVNKSANLRAGPDNDAPVLAVIPANAQVLAQKNCVHWCRAAYKGQKGYVYRALIGHPAKRSKSKRASARKSTRKARAFANRSAASAAQARLVEIGR